MTKRVEQLEARRLRQEEGMSVKKISVQLGVSRGTVSVWVRDVILTDEQKERLKASNPIYNPRDWGGGKVTADNYRKRRIEYQKEGSIRAKDKDFKHIQVCMLYWGEGDKNRNVCGIANTDVFLLQAFVDFLRNEFHVPDHKFRINIQCHLGNGLSVEEIEKYWADNLSVPLSSVRKTTVVYKRNEGTFTKHEYGICRVQVCDTRISQHIFGAIQEYGNFVNEKWLG